MGQRQGTILKKCLCANQECCSHKWTLRYWADVTRATPLPRDS